MEEKDSELRELLREWKAPRTPASLEARVLKTRRAWSDVLLHGYIRVPVPVACGLAILIVGGVWRLTTQPAGCSAASLSPVVAKHAPQVAKHALQKVFVRPANCAGDSNC